MSYLVYVQLRTGGDGYFVSYDGDEMYLSSDHSSGNVYPSYSAAKSKEDWLRRNLSDIVYTEIVEY